MNGGNSNSSILSGIRSMKRKTLLSWSSGKDCAWALYKLQQDPEIDLGGLFCTVNSEFDRVAMHAVRVELLQQQAKSIDLPLNIIEIPYPCSNDLYEEIMALFVEKSKMANIEQFAFGDLFLEDVRNYREEKLNGTGISPIFPIWGVPTDELAKEMVVGGLRAVITCLDPKQISKDFIGREYNESFLNDLPEGVDPCGENGEFHSFVFAGPMFKKQVEISMGNIVQRDGFVFIDVVEIRN
jgi:uncharacterized protein (TIGR00290 family)